VNGLPAKKMSEDALSVKAFIGTETKRNDIPYGYCQCGCGKKTLLAKKTDKRHDCTKGKHLRFINGHNRSTWNGGITYSKAGRCEVYSPNHRKVSSHHKYVFRYRLIGEKVLGKKLPPSAVIHHVDGVVDNDITSNLVLCENDTYHKLLHRRTRAYKACGHTKWLKCCFCQTYDDPKNLYVHKEKSGFHRNCRNEYNKEKRHKNVFKTKTNTAQGQEKNKTI